MATSLKEWLDRLDQCQTYEQLQEFDHNVYDVMEGIEDALAVKKREMQQLEDEVQRLNRDKRSVVHVQFMIKKMAYHRFISNDDGWEVGGKWRVWHE